MLFYDVRMCEDRNVITDTNYSPGKDDESNETEIPMNLAMLPTGLASNNNDCSDISQTDKQQQQPYRVGNNPNHPITSFRESTALTTENVEALLLEDIILSGSSIQNESTRKGFYQYQEGNQYSNSKHVPRVVNCDFKTNQESSCTDDDVLLSHVLHNLFDSQCSMKDHNSIASNRPGLPSKESLFTATSWGLDYCDDNNGRTSIFNSAACVEKLFGGPDPPTTKIDSTTSISGIATQQGYADIHPMTIKYDDTTHATNFPFSKNAMTNEFLSKSTSSRINKKFDFLALFESQLSPSSQWGEGNNLENPGTFKREERYQNEMSSPMSRKHTCTSSTAAAGKFDFRAMFESQMSSSSPEVRRDFGSSKGGGENGIGRHPTIQNEAIHEIIQTSVPYADVSSSRGMVNAYSLSDSEMTTLFHDGDVQRPSAKCEFKTPKDGLLVISQTSSVISKRENEILFDVHVDALTIFERELSTPQAARAMPHINAQLLESEFSSSQKEEGAEDNAITETSFVISGFDVSGVGNSQMSPSGCLMMPIKCSQSDNSYGNNSSKTSFNSIFLNSSNRRDDQLQAVDDKQSRQSEVVGPDNFASSSLKRREKETTTQLTLPKRKRIRKRLNHEPQRKTYVAPKENDVLLGRGGRTNNHPGNVRYLELKDSMQSRYFAGSKEEKTVISQELVDIVHQWGGRFLKLDQSSNDESINKTDNGKWYEVLNIVARRKAGQSLREINTPEERAAKRQKYGLDTKRSI